MKILHVLYSGLGGHGSVVFSMIKGDLENKATHIVLFYGIEELLPEYKSTCEELGLDYYFIKKRPGLDFISWYKSYKIMKKLKCEVTILNSTNLVILSSLYRALYKTKLLVVEHTANAIKTKIEHFRSWFSLRFADKVICLSTLYQNELRNQFGKRMTTNKSRVISNGIDVSLYKKGKEKKHEEVISLGTHLRLVPGKDLTTVFRSLENIRKDCSQEIRFLIAGDGPLRAKFEQLSIELGIQEIVVFLGTLNEKQIVSFLQRLDIYVMSSEAETMSTSVMQAMSCELPIIATDISGINNLIEDNHNGMLFPTGSVEGLGQKMRHLINSVSERDRLGSNARAFAEKELSHIKMFNLYYQEIQDKSK